MFLQMEFELCVAAGIDGRKLSPDVVYDLAGKIIHDAEVTRLALNEMNKAPLGQRGVLVRGTRSKVLRSMTESGRAALRARIGMTPQGPTAQFGPTRAEVRRCQ
jgi:hypothetical protein